MQHEKRFERVLIVDDDDLVRRNVCRLLHQGGFTGIVEASNGSEAVVLARTAQPDFVLLDAEMPYLSGEQAAPLIRAQAPNARIVAFSGKLRQTPPWADAYLSKSVTSMLETFLEVAAWARRRNDPEEEVLTN